VLFTGFQEPLSEDWMREAKVTRVLRKPLMASELRWTIHAVLADAALRT
jgi:hypothetical protein